MTSSPSRVIAPIVGAAGGTLVVAIAANKFGVKRSYAAFGTAAASFIAARNAKGSARIALEAAAIASVCIGVGEVLARFYPKLAKPNVQPVAPQRQAAPPPPPDAVTAKEFRDALATMEKNHEAETQKQLATMHALLTELRDAREQKQTHEYVVEDQPPHDSAAAAERVAAIYPMLNDEERRRWSTMVATMPKEQLTQIERELLRRETASDGVAYLRSTVLSPLRLPS